MVFMNIAIGGKGECPDETNPEGNARGINHDFTVDPGKEIAMFRVPSGNRTDLYQRRFQPEKKNKKHG